jgi:hypothetical protein
MTQDAADYVRRVSNTNPLNTEVARGTPKNAYNLALSELLLCSILKSVYNENNSKDVWHK